METNILFKELSLKDKTLQSIEKKGYKTATKIQAKIIPIILNKKNDIIGISQTGSGKTGSFLIPILDKIGKSERLPKALIITPTRELALQVSKELSLFTENKSQKFISVYGGASVFNQIRIIKKGVNFIIGTPGRIVDLIKRKVINLSKIEYLVLDEADEMLNMGFLSDIEFILSKSNSHKRTFLFSATVPIRIQNLSKKYMRDQVVVEVEKEIGKNNNIEEQFIVTNLNEKLLKTINIIKNTKDFYGLIFCQTKREVDNITKSFKNNGLLVNCIHGGIIQSKREKILTSFKKKHINVLIATDVASRGIDIKNLTHVINYSLPKEKDSYIHRIGRVGRAGEKGIAISLVTSKQKRVLKEFEKVNKTKINEIKVQINYKIKNNFAEEKNLKVKKPENKKKYKPFSKKKYYANNKRKAND